jgi:hypothetical protein
MSTETTILGEWKPERAFVESLRKELGSGSASTLARWRRLDTIPEGYEWRYFGRIPMWRRKKDE